MTRKLWRACPVVSDEISQAFDHPEARAAAARALLDNPDRISLRDFVTDVEIGAFQPERGLTQRLRFNVVVELQPHSGAATDDVDLILSYDKLMEAISTELAAERLNLLETLAERIAARILAEPQPLRVFLRIEKLDRGPFALGVEIVRSRVRLDAAPQTILVHPIVVFFEGDLPDLDRLARLDAPVVLCPALRNPSKAGQSSALRIDLLEIEQSAWAMVEQDPRLSVVASRTEIEWAMKQSKMILWAPSKLVLDTSGAPNVVGNGMPLAVWLAEHLDARELLVHGAVALPAACRVPVARL